MDGGVAAGAYFAASEAQFHVDFIETLTLTKSTLSGKPEPFRLLPPSRKLVANIHGWRRADGSRLYRRVYFSVARKNTKTQTAAGVGLDFLVADDEPSPEIYIAAKDRDQAAICYQAARDMVYASEELSDLLQVTDYRKEIRNRTTGGILRALSSDGKGKHGYNPSVVIIDEFHVWGTSEQELYDALTSGSRARRHPLTLIITTAGTDEYTLCGREYEYACQVRDGKREDPTYLPLIYEVPKDADWADESLWPLANPTLGMVVRLDALREDCEKAKAMPAEQTKFRRLACNQWVNAADVWIPLEKWDACSWSASESIPVTAD